VNLLVRLLLSVINFIVDARLDFFAGLGFHNCCGPRHTPVDLTYPPVAVPLPQPVQLSSRKAKRLAALQRERYLLMAREALSVISTSGAQRSLLPRKSKQ
jgi:hypothetical protein